jgi:Flp pilus assembly protein TadD
LYESGHYDDAISEYKKALTAKPDDFEPHAYLALSYFRIHSQSEGVSEFRVAKKLDPDNSNMSPYFCAYLVDAKDYSDAVYECRKASKALPEDADFHELLGLSLILNGEDVEGKQERDKALSLDPRIEDRRKNP